MVHFCYFYQVPDKNGEVIFLADILQNVWEIIVGFVDDVNNQVEATVQGLAVGACEHPGQFLDSYAILTSVQCILLA